MRAAACCEMNCGMGTSRQRKKRQTYRYPKARRPIWWRRPPARDSDLEPINLDRGGDVDGRAELSRFYRRARKVLRHIFRVARAKDHVQFAFALSPESRGMRDTGWNTAAEASVARKQLTDLVSAIPTRSPVRVRVGLSLYAHMAEVAGYYELPKNMLNIAGGEFWNMYPFHELVASHKVTGEQIAPNASRVLKDLIGHASDIGFPELGQVITEAFDFDLRNGYAHADYIVWSDGIRLPRRNGGRSKTVPYERFGLLLNKALAFFSALQEVQEECLRRYWPPLLVRGRMNAYQAEEYAILTWNPTEGWFQIKMYGGVGPDHPVLRRGLNDDDL
ncbi:hypothetical protein [Devosia sp.]|uniref:hypothetical protein n=1 Tax=Devosia sp. TaxID=1871048 RepID=UPI001ACA938E|nr:hypothetical protein [Devosia sp.]MBN9308998.1 hypothetical protein [Devosia sp.]